MAKVFHARYLEIQSNLRRKKLHRRNQGSNFHGVSFSNRNNVKPQFIRQRRQSQYLKRWFFLKNIPILFHINSTSVIRPVKRNAAVRLSDPSSEANSSYCHRLDILRVESSTISSFFAQLDYAILYLYNAFFNSLTYDLTDFKSRLNLALILELTDTF